MSEVPQLPPIPPASAAPKSVLFGWWPKTSRREKQLRHVVALAFWAYVLLSIFITDVDADIKAALPQNLSWIVTFKLFFFVGGVGLVALLVSTSRIFAWAIYIAFYPLTRLVLFILLLVVILVKTKSWVVVFSALNVCLSIFKSLKANVVIFSGIVVSSAVVFESASSSYLLSAAALLATIAIVIVARRFVSLFQPSQLLKTYVTVIAVMMNWVRDHITPDPANRALQPAQMNDAQRAQWADNLQNAVIIRTWCEILAIKFSDYRRSGLPICITYSTMLCYSS